MAEHIKTGLSARKERPYRPETTDGHRRQLQDV
jgi:hypothetical protein